MTGGEVTYSVGPRYIDGINIDADANAGIPHNQKELQVSDPVTGLYGRGYQPGQENRDGSEL